MPQKVLKFTGINRRVNEFQATGACEELINLRPTASGLEIVKNKTALFETGGEIYNHAFSDISNFIGVSYSTGTYTLRHIFDSSNSTLIAEIPSQSGEHSLIFLGNQLLFSTEGSLFVFAYKNGKYERAEAATPADLSINYTVGAAFGSSDSANPDNSNPHGKIFKEEVIRHWSAAMGGSDNADEIFGPVMVAFNFTLNDGTEFWTNKWIYVNPFHSLPIGDNGKHMIYYEDSDGTKRFTFKSYSLRFIINQANFNDEGINNLISHVNVYASRPVFPYDINTMSAKENNIHEREIYAQAKYMEDLNISNEILYFQKSIPISEIKKGDVSFTLDFSAVQAGDRILNVDAGPTKRTGKMVAYNNRAHVYDSIVSVYPQSIICGSNVNYTYQNRKALVHLEQNGETLVFPTTAFVPALSEGNSVYKVSCCYPDARAKKILIETKENSNKYCTINLKESNRYNYAYGETNYVTSYRQEDTYISSSYVICEPNMVNVSEQYNPFVFPVELSYSFGGKVLDVATSYVPLSSTQIGQYPISVFTASGIFSLEQGKGSVLYGNIIPIKPFVIDGKAEPTPYGTFFVSSKNLYVLVGTEVTDVSLNIIGERELPLRDVAAYKKIVCGTQFPNFCNLLSQVNFEDYVSGCRLIFDQFNNELIISNDRYEYSYVFNINTKNYHKIALNYYKYQNSARYIIRNDGGERFVLDLHSENKEQKDILLQSRPLSLEAFYTHIQRLIMLVDTKLNNSDKLGIFVFGSDNLHDWKPIITAQKQNTVLRQIRTNKAPKSYKDYIIIIAGQVSADTDLSDIIADYTVVSRRLG